MVFGTALINDVAALESNKIGCIASIKCDLCSRRGYALGSTTGSLMQLSLEVKLLSIARKSSLSL